MIDDPSTNIDKVNTLLSEVEYLFVISRALWTFLVQPVMIASEFHAGII